MKKLYSGFDLCAPIDLGVDDDQRPGADDPRDVHEHRHRPAGREVPARRTAAGTRREATDREAVRGPRAPALPRRAARRPRRLRARPARRHRRRRSSTPRPTRGSRADTLARVRGTVQADILKEDQAQNTCIFRTEFALRMMGDIQQFFVDNKRAQLLLGVDLRLPHRRGRREPDLASSPSRWRTASRSSSTTSRAA